MSGWTRLKRDAELIDGTLPEHEANLNRRFKDMLHIDDPDYIQVIRDIGQGLYKEEPLFQLRALMPAYQVQGGKGTHSASSFIEALHRSPELKGELIELADALDARTNEHFKELPGLENTGLKLHSAYKIREILTAVGFHTETSYSPHQAGVWRNQEEKLELMFVTLDKQHALHEGVAYDDYAISCELFHWQSQNTTAPDTTTGKQYLNSATNGWRFQLFIRLNKHKPYRACGPVLLVKSEGARPMNITWRLAAPLTAKLFSEYSVVR